MRHIMSCTPGHLSAGRASGAGQAASPGEAVHCRATQQLQSSDTTEPSCCSGASRWRSWHVSREIIRLLVIICCDLRVCNLTVTMSLFRGAGWAAVNMKSWSIDQMCDNKPHCESVRSSNKMFCKYCFNTDFLMRQSWNLKIDIPGS